MPGHCPKLCNHQLKQHKMSEMWHHAGHTRTPVVNLTLEDHVLPSSRTWERVCRQLGTSLPPGHPQVATHANTDLSGGADLQHGLWLKTDHCSFPGYSRGVYLTEERISDVFQINSLQRIVVIFREHFMGGEKKTQIHLQHQWKVPR